ncbi:MAG: hypothetical protein Q8L39_15610 [Burkholderiales bacterium]|nr:hypothetical protein [Burkholderiales bacterium]
MNCVKKCLLLLLWSPAAFALSPYVSGDKLAPGDVALVAAQAESKLQAEGFKVIGKHFPKGLPQHAVVIVTHKPILDAIQKLGGPSIVNAGIRVGVKSDGTVSYINPEYWQHAFFRRNYSDELAKDLSQKLGKALGAGKHFGGDEPAADLSNYRYMVGMEKFESNKNELNSFGSFEQALKAVQGNLAKGVNHTAKVYEVIMPEKKVAVFGVAFNDTKTGEGWWVKRIGADNIAAVPYEMYIVGNKVYALYGRYRIAVGWPALGMGTFMAISDAPDIILEALTDVAGGAYEKSSAF